MSTAAPGGYFAHPGRPALLEAQFGSEEQLLLAEVYDPYRKWQAVDGMTGERVTVGLVRRLWACGFERVMVSEKGSSWNLEVVRLLEGDAEALRNAP